MCIIHSLDSKKTNKTNLCLDLDIGFEMHLQKLEKDNSQ